MNLTNFLTTLDQIECNETLNVKPLFGEDLVNEMDLIEMQKMLDNEI